jgi:coenzyme Q-binding protein COQ10
MSVFQTSKIMPYTAHQIYDLVCDIPSYPQFLPWCKQAHIVNRINQHNLHAELTVAFHNILQKYTSDVEYSKINIQHFVVEANAIKGPFQKLYSKWEIKGLDNNFCKVNFFLDFTFNSFLLNKTIGLVFANASQKMINAFEKRAQQIYGSK